MVDTLQAARSAVERCAWEEARAAFAAADQNSALSADDLQQYADAAWWSGHPDEAVEALERAYAGRVEAGDIDAAAMVAGLLAYLAFRRLSFAVAAGWKSKAERLLAGNEESPARAWLELLNAVMALFGRNDLDETIAAADKTLELARRHDDPAVQAHALGFKGAALVRKGQWKEGMSLIDEATAAAVSGELDLRSACDVYCNTITCCTTLADYRRASEWTEEADRWMQRNSLGGYPGVCRVHRAELKKLHGAYPEAEQEARAACAELERFGLFDDIGFAHYEIGETRLRMGDLDAAAEAFSRAYEYGSDALPGMALLRLARGDAEGAAATIGAALARSDGGDAGADPDRLRRSRLLPAQVTIAAAAGDLDTAITATEELEGLAADYERPAFEAAALTARGTVELHRDQPDDAAAHLDKAWRRWRDIDLPYESARARVLLGRAKAADGDETTARMELTAARATFQRIGAALDLQEVDDLLGEEAAGTAGTGERVTKTFVFTDIVTSTDLVELIGDEAWTDVLRLHDRTVRDEVARYRGREVRSTGDGFFLAFDRAGDAIDAAVAVQRRLASHRRDRGFVPYVRVGIHTSEATIDGRDFAGLGVHVAARVGDIGDRDDIVVSRSALDAAGAVRYPVSEPRFVELKGVAEPVEVVTIDWA